MRRHIVWLVLDSARYDAVAAASTPNLDRLGPLEERFSYATWTAPSHYTFVMGLVPHRAPQGVFASEVYREDYLRWRERIGDEAAASLEFRSFLPALSLPRVLGGLGYRTTGFVSLPVLNPATAIGRDFDRYELWPSHNDFAGMVDEMVFDDDGPPQFYFCNLGETHYPYALPGEPAEDLLPHISGVHGVVKRLDDQGGPADAFFDAATMDRLRQKQIACVEHVDAQLGRLFAKAPRHTWFIVTADHGEAFGEGGFFGHGPVTDPIVLRVPFVEGPHPDAAG